MARVLLQSICKNYGDVPAVRKLDLEIRDEEFMVLVGPSGCGKSTSLRMIAGLEDITSGDLWIGDRRVNEVSPKDRDIAMVFQNYALYPHMTVRENMAFGLKLRKLAPTEIKKRVDEAAQILGITEYLERRPKALSGGQRQRVAMGRAIVRYPSVFLFDEPLSNLDAKLRVQMRVELARLHQRLRTTIVYVTHDQVEAMTLADRIAIMDNGVLQQLGTPHEVYHRPKNRFVASFIGSPGMNFLTGHVQATNFGHMFAGAGFSFSLSSEIVELLQNHRHSEQLTIGIRPQYFHIANEHDRGTVESVAEVVEHLGSEKYVYFRLGDTLVTARVAEDHPVRAGDPVRYRVDNSRVSLFSEDGNSIFL
ncbi:MAG: sn-glycerol-3-phosphate ABC transporter ATP-binding protein UgpC [Myxococcales bacterium]|nr:sn-glycerol-3-phosphate ABC transporter ATP-binding protein UgpC [Myxococcales bacterium]